MYSSIPRVFNGQNAFIYDHLKICFTLQLSVVHFRVCIYSLEASAAIALHGQFNHISDIFTEVGFLFRVGCDNLLLDGVVLCQTIKFRMNDREFF